jgi:hypothetical protein
MGLDLVSRPAEPRCPAAPPQDFLPGNYFRGAFSALFSRLDSGF